MRRSRTASSEMRRSAAGEQSDHRKARQCPVFAFERSAAPSHCICRMAPLTRRLPARRLRDAASDPKSKQSGKHTNQIHPPPCIGADPADRQPQERGKNAAQTGATLQEISQAFLFTMIA